jgi:hypothetical protein
MKTSHPSSANVRPFAIAAAALNRNVVATSSPLDAWTMKVTATAVPQSISVAAF